MARCVVSHQILRQNDSIPFVVVDVEDDPETEGARTVVFRSIEGFEPPTIEMAVEAAK